MPKAQRKINIEHGPITRPDLPHMSFIFTDALTFCVDSDILYSYNENNIYIMKTINPVYDLSINTHPGSIPKKYLG
jgi:hypothetical protein